MTEKTADFGTVHVPVMAREVVEALQPGPEKMFIDGTLGGGGHTRMLLDAGATVWACDQDETAVLRAKTWGAAYGERLQAVVGNFGALLGHCGRANGHWGGTNGPLPAVDGILLDLGISSDQLDDPERGLSYQAEGPLDMRMNQADGATVAEVVNSWDEKALAQVMFDYAEEPKARVLARAIVHARKTAPLVTTLDLLRLVEQVYPPRFGLKRSHPAGRIFQAFRIVVNGELQALEAALPRAAELLKPGGRLVVITFHSLEERLVKRVFKELAVDELDSVGRVVKEAPFKVWKKQLPSADEVAANPRARSAHVRVLEKRVASSE